MNRERVDAARQKIEWVLVFDEVYAAYKELNETYGTNAAIDYFIALDGSSGGSGNTHYVTPNMGDFITDFELQAKRVLDLTLYFAFMNVFALRAFSEESVPKHIIFLIKWKVGQELKKSMYPIAKYLRGKVVERVA